MDAFTYKCPGCGSGLTYDIKTKYFHCETCGQYFELDNPSSPDDNLANNVSSESNSSSVVTNGFESNVNSGATLDLDFLKGNKTANSTVAATPREEFMDMRIYHCSSCGSELMTRDEEVAKFCSYCGQNTIMFDRISREKCPQKIIPFSITKDEALRRAKFSFGQGKYSFTNINEVSVDSVRGIYMPYWVYDCEMHIETETEVKSDKGRTFNYKAQQDTSEKVILDASKKFSDTVSIKLNPFRLIEARDFDMGYLAGFYADRCDVDSKDRENSAYAYLSHELQEKILDTTPGVPHKYMRENYTGYFDYRNRVNMKVVSEDFKCHSVEYMFLPVYFITFTSNGETVILLVNGQSGKIVGNVPVSVKIFKRVQGRDMLLWGIFWGIAGALLFRYIDPLWAAGFIGLIAFFTRMVGVSSKNKFLKYYKETNSKDMFKLSNDR